MSKTTTKGGFDPEQLKVGDILYEYEYGCVMKSVVCSAPTCSIDEDGQEIWEWKAKHNKSDQIIHYRVGTRFSHYGPNVYLYEAYLGCLEI